LSQASDRNDG